MVWVAGTTTGSDMATDFNNLSANSLTVSYLDIYSSQASISLQTDSTSSTNFILPSPTTFVTAGNAISYNSTTGLITFNKTGNYLCHFMFNLAPTANGVIYYKAATFLNGVPTAYFPSGRLNNFTNNQNQQAVFDTNNYWVAGTQLGIYITLDNTTKATLVTQDGTYIGTQPIKRMAARFQIQGFAPA